MGEFQRLYDEVMRLPADEFASEATDYFLQIVPCMLAEIARLRAERRWASVEERGLPGTSLSQRYLVVIDGLVRGPAKYLPYLKSLGWFDPVRMEKISFPVSHYMPLPDPPEVTP